MGRRVEHYRHQGQAGARAVGDELEGRPLREGPVVASERPDALGIAGPVRRERDRKWKARTFHGEREGHRVEIVTYEGTGGVDRYLAVCSCSWIAGTTHLKGSRASNDAKDHLHPRP